MKNIWIFGSCFSWGYGCRPSYEYSQKYKTSDDKLWTDIVSDKLGLNLIDKSIPTYATNFDVLKSFILNINDIKSGDIVIYEIVKPLGFLKLNQSKTKVRGYTSYTFDKDKFWRDDEDKKIGIQYVDLNIKGYDKQWVDFFYPQIDSLSKILLDRNIKTFVWSYEVYEGESRFESISTATNESISDFHYSFEGHKQMSNYILNMIKSNQHIKSKLI